MAPKRGRGRPKKLGVQTTTLDSFSSITAPTTPEAAAAAIAVLGEGDATRSHLKRFASRKANENLAQLIDPSVVQVDEDDEFIPEDQPEEDGYEEEGFIAAEGEATPKVKKARTTGNSKRGRKPKHKVSLDEEIRAMTPTSKLDNKRRIIRGLKDLTSARDKIERIYGLNENKLLGLAKVKEGFETSVFDFPEENIQTNSQFYVDSSPPCSKENIFDVLFSMPLKYSIIDEGEFGEMFQLRKDEIRLLISGLETPLHTGQRTEFPVLPCGKRTGFVHNVGALVTGLAWLNTVEGQDQYLAVSMSQYKEDPVDPHLKMFGREEHISCIDIYSLNPLTLEFKKMQTIVHNFGESWDLKWHEGAKGSHYLGVLGCVCQDGSVKFFGVEKNQEYQIRMFDEALISISIPQASISCFDFITPHAIVCGFQNGYVAEFDLITNLPCYYHKVHDSYIISVVTAYSNFEDVTVGTLSVDGYLSVFNPKDIRTTKCVVGRARGGNNTPIVYSPQLYSFVHSDGVNSIKAFPPRAIFATHQICLHENTVTSMAVSKLHPLLLSGSADGTLIINNLARRFLTGIKNNTTTYRYLKLWKWDYSLAKNLYRLDPNYEVYKFSVNEVSKAQVDPHGINISCVKWNETPQSGKFYAFVNNAGLLVVEKLGAAG